MSKVPAVVQEAANSRERIAIVVAQNIFKLGSGVFNFGLN